MRSIEEVQIILAWGTPRLSNILTWGIHLLRRAQVNRAMFYGVVGYGWRFVAGPVSVILIGTYFSPEVQGYYYTFSSLLALQLFFELGLSGVITQFASHEWAHLSLDNHRRIVGDAHALSRLVSLARATFRWYLVAAVMFVVVVSLWGLVFFSRSPGSTVNWVAPWIALCALTGLTLWLLSVWALLEGCNQISQVYAFRAIQAVLTNLSMWIAIVLGAGLWTACVYMAVGLVWAAVFILRNYRQFLGPFWAGPSGERIDWWGEVWSMQWRIAVSYLSGYFTGYIYTPILFYFHGPVVAGQFGMTWSLITAVGFVGNLWSATRVPQFGMLIARRQYAELDRLLFRIWRISVVALMGGAAAVWLLLFGLTVIGPRFASRLLPPLPAALLLLGIVVSNSTTSASNYIRAHKREPFMWISLTAGAMTGGLVWLLASQFGAIGAAAAYAGVAVILFPWGVWIWYRCRWEWHADGEDTPCSS